MDWKVEYLPPVSYRTLKDWMFYFTKGQGVTVVRILGVTVRVVK